MDQMSICGISFINYVLGEGNVLFVLCRRTKLDDIASTLFLSAAVLWSTVPRILVGLPKTGSPSDSKYVSKIIYSIM